MNIDVSKECGDLFLETASTRMMMFRKGMKVMNDKKEGERDCA